ncbi:hypothetical protein EV368DRAFT_84140 [Lentinula lateritia]|nr:hypothetical protein EV368DRAFT_84140 [Lentinula lateritia]
MDAQPRFTRSGARAALPGEDNPAPHQSFSLCQSILGPPPGEVADTPVTPPPTFVHLAWINPRPNGKDALRAHEAIRASCTRTQASNPAESPSFSPSPCNDPVAQFSGASSTAGGSPMAQDSGHSDDEWFGVAGSDPYDPNDAYATSGEEGAAPAHHSRLRSVFSSPTATDFHRDTPPVELSPSALVPETSDSRPGLQPAPRIHSSRRTTAEHRGRGQHSNPYCQSRPRARTREVSPGPDFGSHFRRSSRSLSPVAHYAPACFNSSSLQLGRSRDNPSSNALNYVFWDPCQGEISSSVPAAILNQVNPLVISALHSGWPTFISLNYLLGESSVSAVGETWDVDEAGQVKFKMKQLKELSFKSISQRDWDSISKNMPRALMHYFIPPGECGIRLELAYEIAQMFKCFFDMLSDQPDFYEAYESYVEYAHKIYSFWFSHLEINLRIDILRPSFFDRIWARNVHRNKHWTSTLVDSNDTSQMSKPKKFQKGSYDYLLQT